MICLLLLTTSLSFANDLKREDEHRYLTNMINSFHPGNAKFVRIENMDHGPEQSASQLESLERRRKNETGQFNVAILNEIHNWLRERS